MIELTVQDLIERDGNDVFYTQLLHGRVVALSSRTGRQLFDSRTNKKEHIERYYTCRVDSIWASTKETKDNGFSGTWFQPVTMLYIKD